MTFDEPDAPSWGVDPPSIEAWSTLAPGTEVRILKRSGKHGGEIRAEYPGTVVSTSLPMPWIEFEATWTLPDHQQGPLRFETGDILREAYSPIHPYDAFAVYTPNGSLKGWYANVTYPARLTWKDGRAELTWHDLFIDLAATPDGRYEILDEEELEESGLSISDPGLHQRILTARDELMMRFKHRRSPFSASGTMNRDTIP